jgi:hypothetical protein
MRWRRIILGGAALALAAVAGLLLAAVALYRSPASVKALVEGALSSRFGAAVSIGGLEYALDPAGVTAEEITLGAGPGASGIALGVSRLAAKFRLEGAFGDRTLWVSRLELSGVTLAAEAEGRWREGIPDAGPPSWWGRAGRQAISFLWFRHLRLGDVAVSGADLTLTGEGLRVGLQGLSAATTSEGIEIKGKALIDWPQAASAFEAQEFSATVSLAFSEGRGVFGGRLDLPAALYRSPRAKVALARAAARFRVQAGSERVMVDEGHLESATLTLDTEPTGTVALKSPRLSVAGNLDRAGRVLDLSHWELAASGLAEAGGRARLKLNPPYAIEVFGIDARLWPEEWLEPAARAAGLPAAPLALAGAVGVSGEFTVRHTGRGWVEEGRLNAEFSQNRIGLSAGPVRVEGRVSGSVQASGRAAAPVVTARLSGRQVELTGAGLVVAPFAFEADAEGAFPVLALPRLEARVPAVALPVGGKTYALEDLLLRAENGKCDLSRAEASMAEIHLSSDLIRNLRGALAADGRQVAITLAGRGVGLARAAARFDLLPPGWRLEATDRLQAQAVIRPEGASSLSATLDLSRLGFADAAQSRAAENMSLRAKISAQGNLKGKSLTADAAVSASGGELLWEQVYLDLGRNPAAASARIRYAAGDGWLQVEDGRLAIENLVRVGARGRIRRPGPGAEYDLTLQLPPTPIAPLFAHFVAEPLRFRQPALSGLRLAGDVSAELHLSGAGAQRTLKGHVGWQAGNAAAADGGIGAEGIELRLPVWYQGGGNAGAPAPVTGKLTVRRIALPGLPAQELALALSAWPNQLSAGPGLSIRLPSGEVRFGPIEGRDVFGPQPSFRTRLAAERVQLGGYLEGLWSVPVDALLNGELEEVVFDGRDLRSRGQLVADVFGGKVAVSAPGVGAVFGPAPNLRADCRIDGLDLYELTRGTAFGRISGVLSGSVEGLEVVGGQPQGFVLELETVRREGVPQRINVAAVENIARIGGGQSPFVGLAGNFAAFFKEFSYDRIGVRAELENDVFKVNGTVLEDGVEYLVKRGGIPGVDVVNLNPVNRISFRDMVKRIRRVAESESGPVVR